MSTKSVHRAIRIARRFCQAVASGAPDNILAALERRGERAHPEYQRIARGVKDAFLSR